MLTRVLGALSLFWDFPSTLGLGVLFFWWKKRRCLPLPHPCPKRWASSGLFLFVFYFVSLNSSFSYFIIVPFSLCSYIIYRECGGGMKLGPFGLKKELQMLLAGTSMDLVMFPLGVRHLLGTPFFSVLSHWLCSFLRGEMGLAWGFRGHCLLLSPHQALPKIPCALGRFWRAKGCS